MLIVAVSTAVHDVKRENIPIKKFKEDASTNQQMSSVRALYAVLSSHSEKLQLR